MLIYLLLAPRLANGLTIINIFGEIEIMLSVVIQGSDKTIVINTKIFEPQPPTPIPYKGMRF